MLTPQFKTVYTLRQYLLTLFDSRGLTRTLGEVDVCHDERGRPGFSAGNSAAVFRIRLGGRIRSLRCYLRPMRHLKEIYGDRLLEKELYLHTSAQTGVWVDVVLGDWIEGLTLHEAAAQAAALRDRECLQILARLFDRLAFALVTDDCAHGDLKPENIIVSDDGTLHPIDFDASYLPAFAGETSPELGTAAYQHPARTAADFDERIDDSPAALISTALHALAADPTLWDRYGSTDGLLYCPQRIAADAAYRETLALFEQFADRPERRSAPHGQQRRPEDVPHGDRTDDRGNAHHQEQPPDFHAEIVFALGDHRVKDADDQKGSYADDDARQIVLR